ncbi:hypothetical protein Ddye_005414 [Dipteronia dyeriana]|uniref:Uncharacterized protein n=1 Tax=Dipteronia dyeriana TaxID=168575 RepID=A0AAD9XGS1_9ROSI|nr:hypothetical protein Ddye_005414 [Dipteronia dyeriana]
MSNSLTPDSDAMVECQKPPSGGTNLHQVFDTKQQEYGDRIEDLLENDVNAFGLQTWLSDEAVQDVFSTDSLAAALTSFTWQPMFQFQDMDFFPAEHEHEHHQ